MRDILLGVMGHASKLRALGEMDLYHRLVTRPWWVLVALVGASFLAANVVFGLAYMFAGGVAGARPGNFTDAFFFSVETLSTIGYGVMSPETPVAHLLVTLESFNGLMGLALVAGLVFARFSLPVASSSATSPASRSTTDGPHCSFGWRMRAAITSSKLSCASPSSTTTPQPRATKMRRMCDIELERDTSSFFNLSWLAVHVIDESSPLWECTRESLTARDTQIVVSLVGIDESLSQTIHARKIYSTDRILWGRRFVDVIERLSDGRRRVDNRRLSETEEAPAPSWR